MGPTGEERPAFCDNPVGKWKAKIAVENAESALRMKENVANGKAGLGLHTQRWWSKESSLNRRKMVLEEIHHLEEVKRFFYSCRTKETGRMDQVGGSAKDRPVTWSNPQVHETKEIKFSHKSSLRRLTKTSQPSCLGVNHIQLMQSMSENCPPQTYSHIRRHNEVLDIFAEVSKICCETANKALNIINNRAIQFV